MKRVLCLISLALALMILLCSCGNNQGKLIGTWAGDGNFDILGVDAPFEFAQQWTFSKDGTAAAVVDSRNVEFTYYLTDDTITLIMADSEVSWGIAYTLKGSTLLIKTGGSGNAEFEKIA